MSSSQSNDCDLSCSVQLADAVLFCPNLDGLSNQLAPRKAEGLSLTGKVTEGLNPFLTITGKFSVMIAEHPTVTFWPYFDTVTLKVYGNTVC